MAIGLVISCKYAEAASDKLYEVAKTSKKPVGIIVRRGALRRFDALTRKTADLPVMVSWDRRVADRRDPKAKSNKNHRHTERRRKPPYTWEVADFIVVDTAPEVDQPSKPMIEAKPKRAARAQKREKAS